MIEGILFTIRELIPSVTIHCQTVASVEDLRKQGFSKKGITGNAGLHYGDNEVSIWFDLSRGAICLLRVSREHISLTKGEADILGRLPDALSGLLVSSGSRSLELAQRIAARLSVATILVARYLRGGKATTYWTPVLVLGELQQLTFRRYEGHPCTTGFVYTSKPNLYFASLPIEEYSFIPFTKPVTLRANQLDTPASFRYVDGRNSFYLIDNWQKLHGIFVASDPKRFGMVDRCSLMHVLPLVKTMPGRVWAAVIGQNNDVNVVASGGIHLRWDGNYWHMRDISILTSILATQGCSQDLSNAIAMVCHTLSDIRSGTVLLIPDDVVNLPDSVGSIDSSDLGKALLSAFQNQSFVDLTSSNSILGVLTSDGLTTISKDGSILSCGDIIDISNATHTKPAGGGRTHAAVSASAYGVAIKVSEDGPITVFKHGEQLIRM
jgi:hypothetical protein